MIWEDTQSIVNYNLEEQIIGQMIQGDPNILLTLTWCHRTPADTPTRPCITSISLEHQLDDVACACYVGRKGVADTLASNKNAPGRVAAALLHQGCPVAVRDCQVVEGTVVIRLNVKCSEL